MPLMQLRHCCARFGFALTAYCFMPDHLHALLTAVTEEADFCACVRQFKQLTGFVFKKEHGVRLWQPGYHERILRDAEATEAVVRYVLENPIRAGLATQIGEYPWAGSDTYDLRALLTAWDGQT